MSDEQADNVKNDNVEQAEDIESFGTIARKLGPAGVLAVIAATLPAIGGFILLGSVGIVGPWFKEQELVGWLLYVVSFALLSGFALLPTYAQAFLGGWAFGIALGLPGAICGITGGAIIGYVVARRASGDRVLDLINEHAKWQAVADALVGRGFLKTLGIVTLVRIPPNSPFALTNLLMASVRVPLPTYVLGTVIGIAPRTAVAVALANSISGAINSDSIKEARPTWLIVGGIVVALIALGVIGHIGNKAIEKVVGADVKKSPAADNAESA